MPTPLIKKYAEQTGKSVGEVEAIWDQAKEIADNAFKGNKSPRYWAYVNGIVRKRLKLSESCIKELALLAETHIYVEEGES